MNTQNDKTITWNKEELKDLFKLSSVSDNWENISGRLNKNKSECIEIYNLVIKFAMTLYQEEVRQVNTNDFNHLIEQNKPIIDSKKRRLRRKANQIERYYLCQEKNVIDPMERKEH